jgi:DNA-binding NarL/FixJ family response regulator
MIKVMIVDNEILLRETLIFTLNQEEDIKAIDGGGNGYKAIDLCLKHSPDIILMDLKMPKLSGVEAIKRIKKINNKVKIIVLTSSEDEKKILESIENGADGYILKHIKPDELMLAIKSVSKHLFVSNINILNLVKRKYIFDNKGKTLCRKYNLSLTEIEIIRLMVEGESNKEIGNRLNYTEGTIKNKVSKILSKLGTKDRTQIAVFAIKNKLI